MTTKILLAFTFSLTYISFSIYAQTNKTISTDTLQLRIQKVENSLSPLVQIKGASLWNIKKRMKKYNIPGLSIAVINDFKIEWAKAYGNTNSSKENSVTITTAFQAASISKFVNAVAMMKLMESKKQSLDKNINEYLTSWKFPYTKNEEEYPITIRQLLSHTAGLSTHGFGGYKNPNKLPNIIEILEGVKPANSDKVTQVLVPNQKFKYSGGGTTISQLIIMDQTNSTYENFIRKTILIPLQMTNSFYSTEFDKYPNDIANGHTHKGKPLKNNYNIYPESAAAGLWTTPTDLAKLIIDIQLNLQNETGKILSNSSSKELILPTIEKSNSALGLFTEREDGELYVQHSGSNRGFRGKIYFSTSNGNGIVVMLNGTNTEIIEEIIRSVASVYNWSGHEKIMISEELTTKREDLTNYTGTYVLANREIEVQLKRGKLILSEKGKWSSKLTSIGSSKFIVDIVKPKATIEFVTNAKGSINKCILTQGEATEWIKKN